MFKILRPPVHQPLLQIRIHDLSTSLSSLAKPGHCDKWHAGTCDASRCQPSWPRPPQSLLLKELTEVPAKSESHEVEKERKRDAIS